MYSLDTTLYLYYLQFTILHYNCDTLTVYLELALIFVISKYISQYLKEQVKKKIDLCYSYILYLFI